MTNIASKSTLARLLAKENINVQEANTETASFNVETRTLSLPPWKDQGKDVMDLLIGHEVGHALYTPAEFADIDFPQNYLNVVEDIRIEKLVQNEYPGLVGSFKRGYRNLFEIDLFGTKDRDLSTYGLADRINIKAKLREFADVPFTSNEADIVRKCFAVNTFEEAVEAARALYQFASEEAEKEETGLMPENSNSGVPESSNGGDNAKPMPSDDSDDFREEEGNGNGSSMESKEEETDTEEEGGEEEIVAKEFDADSQTGTGEATISDTPTDGLSRPKNDPAVVETDIAYENNRSSLVEEAPNGGVPVVVNQFTPKEISEFVINYKELSEARKEFPVYESFMIDKKNAYDQFMAESKKIVGSMAREFEMRKAAYRYSRSKISKTGSLDMTKVHSYKYNEDIFARTTQLADGKNHGMVMLVDYSGSMYATINKVLRQTINLAMFCRKVNIPFRVYGFTNNSWGRSEAAYNIEMKGFLLLELLSNEMSKKEFDLACREMYSAVESKYERLGMTPLNESLVMMHTILPAFKEKYGIDKVNLTVLTDGDTSQFYVTNYNHGVSGRFAVSRLNGKNITWRNGYTGTEQLLTNLRETIGCNVIGYFISERTYDFRRQLYRAGMGTWEEQNDMRKQYNKNGFTSLDNVMGYDRFFIVKNSKNLDTKVDEFEVPDDASKAVITREFKKMNSSKKGNRLLVTQFAEMVA